METSKEGVKKKIKGGGFETVSYNGKCWADIIQEEEGKESR